MEEKVELLACPFCGGEASLTYLYSSYGGVVNNTVGCSCGCRGKTWSNSNSLQEAIKHWNTRVEVANEKL